MNFSDMVGKVIDSIEQGHDRIIFYFADGTAAESLHMQDCCESVVVDRIEGDIAAVVGIPVIEADETSDSENKPSEYSERYHWTRDAVYHDAGHWVQFHDSDGWSWVWVWTKHKGSNAK